MKAFNNWWVVILLLVTFTKSLQAEINLQISYRYEYLKAFALTLENLQNQRHTIRLEDANGVPLIQEEVSQKVQFGRMYNLEELPEGKYNFVVENEWKVISQPIVVNRRFLSIYPTEQKEILKPAIKIEPDVIAINMLHFEKEAILISIETEQEESVYSNAFKPFGSLNKQLNISRLSKGKYTVTIKTNTYKVRKHFTRGMESMLLAGKF